MTSPNESREVGLCTDCHHHKRVESGKGSVFWYCRRSETDPNFARYPRLPVTDCPGYEPIVRREH